MEQQAKGFFEEVGAIEGLVEASQGLQSGLLVIGEVLWVVPEGPAGALELVGQLDLASAALCVKMGRDRYLS